MTEDENEIQSERDKERERQAKRSRVRMNVKKFQKDEKDRVREIIFVLSKFKVELIASDQPIRSIKMSLKPFSNTV